MNRMVVGQASRLPLGRLAPAFFAGETPAKTAGTAAPLLPRARSCSQCAHTMAWGLSMNLKTLALILKGLRVSGSWSQCMRKKTERGLSMNVSFSSRSDEAMLAVGFSPRTADRHTVGRRGATRESSDRERSGVALRHSSFLPG